MKTAPQDSGAVSVVNLDVQDASRHRAFHHVGQLATRMVIEGMQRDLLSADIVQKLSGELPSPGIGERLVVFGVGDRPRLPGTGQFAGNATVLLLAGEPGKLAPVLGELFGVHAGRSLLEPAMSLFRLPGQNQSSPS